ncbi:hypothetical protein Aperf_G00000053967 [Anoplocephala perfoliata]
MPDSATRRSFAKDLQDLFRKIDSSTDGQAAIERFDEQSITVALKPKVGINAHAVFHMLIRANSSYPTFPPELVFSSPIFHPNIDSAYGSICLNFLNDWQSCYSLLDLVKAILYLIENPNYNSINNSITCSFNPSEYEIAARRLLAGLPVNGRSYEPNVEWCEWARENGCFPTEDEAVDPKKESSLEDSFLEEPKIELEIKELDSDSLDGSSIASSETVPSFAKVRHSLSDHHRKSQELYYPLYSVLGMEMHRIVIQEPLGQKSSMFYFLEMLGDPHHRSELGPVYDSLFMSTVVQECQTDSESRQTSRSYLWRPFEYIPDYSFHSSNSTVSLNYMIDFIEQGNSSLTADFCEEFEEDALGLHIIFNKLFSERFHQNTGAANFLDVAADDVDDDEDDGEGGFTNMFDLEPFDSGGDTVVEPQELLSVAEPEPEADSEPSGDVVKDYEECSTFEESDTMEEKSFGRRRPIVEPFSEESSVYADVPADGLPMRLCKECVKNVGSLRDYLSTLKPVWMFLQTRWPVRFSPQQRVDLSMKGINIPPWRVSSALMLNDCCRYCAGQGDVGNLALLDPMALSPLSPLLNLVRYSVEPKPQLVGIMWMTPFDAMSPFYHVPVPVEEGVVYPQPMRLRLLTVGGFLTNWVSWISRIEAYSLRGKSRFSPFIEASVASSILEPLSMGCGQAPLMDLWPLWMIRHLLRSSLRIFQFSFPSLKSDVHFLFPFSDIDEI